MKVLVFGGKGWIGGQFIGNTEHEVVVATTRPDHYNESYEEIKNVKPDCVISFLGRTFGTANGKLIPSIDYLELPGKLYDNMRDNFYAPYNLAHICEELKIHFIYLGTVCIYTYTENKKIFTEDDVPNFFGSGYSTVKGYTDRFLRNFKNTLQLRIRMPVSKLVSGRNLIDKLLAYPNICSIPNSMTVLDELLPVLIEMALNKQVGTVNLTNPGLITHNEILEMYKEIVDPEFTWTNFTIDEQNQILASKRSNNCLDTTKLTNISLNLKNSVSPIKESVRNVLQRMSKINKK